jgi:hypothetical protein
MYRLLKQPNEALPYYDRLVREFEKSEFLDRAKKRMDELKATMEAKEPAAAGPGRK